MRKSLLFNDRIRKKIKKDHYCFKENFKIKPSNRAIAHHTSWSCWQQIRIERTTVNYADTLRESTDRIVPCKADSSIDHHAIGCWHCSIEPPSTFTTTKIHAWSCQW